ncbi:achaete-scute homolog 1-like [Diadema setosum]|uniref:achaete-scute homolog 1-like n=1 Tax=Diadema antillarum TaxID=105358 RepID=UPI003A863AE2
MDTIPIALHTSCQLIQAVNVAANQTTTTRTMDDLPKRVRRIRVDTSQPQLTRCKRRIHFNHLGYELNQPAPAAVARRNERERNRVKLVNLGFTSLRQQLPNGAGNKKMSKVETLRSAVTYIKRLQEMLDEEAAVNAVLNGHSIQTSTVSLSSAASSPACSPDSSSSEPLSPDDEDLLNFPEWF